MPQLEIRPEDIFGEPLGNGSYRVISDEERQQRIDALLAVAGFDMSHRSTITCIRWIDGALYQQRDGLQEQHRGGNARIPPVFGRNARVVLSEAVLPVAASHYQHVWNAETERGLARTRSIGIAGEREPSLPVSLLTPVTKRRYAALVVTEE